jgi:penicillin-insensitive murein DD-endopeptidase
MRIINFLLSGALAISLLLFLFAMREGKPDSEPQALQPVNREKLVPKAAIEPTPDTSALSLAPPPAVMPADSASEISTASKEIPAVPHAPDPEPQPVQPASIPAGPASLPAQPASLPAQQVREAWQSTTVREVAVPQPDVKAPAEVPASPPSPANPAQPAIKKTAIAKNLFAAVKEPANLATRSIGFYAHGCLAGGKPLPINGPAWQVMRIARNRNWGHPALITFIERFAEDAKQKDGWPGLLIGDLSMPRGGPMPFGHASHQIGLDVDIWYKPEPDHELTAREREDVKMESFLSDPAHINPEVWKPEYEKLLRRAVSYPEVARIFVNPAIKKWLCDNAKGDRSFLHKITPIMGHDDHFHVRLVCPPNNPGCEGQPPMKTDEGCGKGLDKWVEALAKPKPATPLPAAPVPAAPTPATPKQAKAPVRLRGLAAKIQSWKRKAMALRSKRSLTMAQLPPECEKVLKAEPVPAGPASVTAAR